jgi:hypothetical protein
VASLDFEVEADTREQAEAKAVEQAHDADFTNCTVDYEFDIASLVALGSKEPEDDLDSEIKRCPDLGDGTCALCPTVFPGVSDETIDAGWLPSYWIGEEEQEGPVCPNCAKQFLVHDPQYGESVLNLKGEYVSRWDGGVEVKSPCTVDPRTRKISIKATHAVNVETLDREYVVLNGKEYAAANEEERDQFTPEEQSQMFFWA